MIIYMFTGFSKKGNSTKQPVLSSGVQYNCRLKAPTSVISPVIELDQGNDMSFKNYSYAYIPDFFRYYIVSDITSEGRIWTYSLQTDVLATYKDQIGAASLYILRSSNTYNHNVVDTFYPALASFTVDKQTLETPWSHIPIDGAPSYYIAITRGCFVLGVLAQPEPNQLGSYGCIKYIALKYNQMRTLISALMSNVALTNGGFAASDASLALQRAIVNPLSFVKSCYWVPLSYDELVGSEETTITIWDWTLTADCKLLSSNPYLEKSIEFSVPGHPQAVSRGRYLNLEPYTEYTLFYPPFGLIPINGMDVLDAEEIRCTVCIDIITGTGRLELYTQNNNVRDRLIMKMSAQVCVPIQLAEASYEFDKSSLIGMGAGLLGSISAGIAEKFSSGLATELSNIGNAASNIGKRVQTAGSSGNFSDLNGYALFYCKYYDVAAEDNTDVGRPLCEIRTLSSIPGFIMVREGAIALPDATQGEHEAVRAYLEGGFFYE